MRVVESKYGDKTIYNYVEWVERQCRGNKTGDNLGALEELTDALRETQRVVAILATLLPADKVVDSLSAHAFDFDKAELVPDLKAVVTCRQCSIPMAQIDDSNQFKCTTCGSIIWGNLK